MRRIKQKQGALISFFLDGIVNLALVYPWIKQLLDNLVDYYRHLLLKNKNLHCPVCLALYIVRNGKKRRLFGNPIQNYLCMNCGKQFCENIFHRFYRCKYPVFLILCAIDLKRRGNAITYIGYHLLIPFIDNYLQPCYATITRWIKKFGKIVIENTSRIKLRAGKRKHWEIDEEYDSRIIETKEYNKYVKNGKKKAGTFGIMDPHTKLISIESFDFDLSKKAKSMILRTKHKWQTKPRSIWRDGWNSYDKILEELDIPYGTVIHNKEYVSKKGHHDNNIEREWSEKRIWIKQCRGFASFEGRAFYDKLYEAHRNFFCPRETLRGLTPAEKAGLKETITLLNLIR